MHPAIARSRFLVRRQWHRLFALTLLLTTGWIFWHRNYLFRNGPQGGMIGRKLDNTIKSLLFVWRDRAYRKDFSATFDFALPTAAVRQTGVPVLLHTYLSESLYRAKQRQEKQQSIEALCPQCLISPLVGAWYTSSSPTTTSKALDHLTVIQFQESELEDWMYQKFHDEVIWEMHQSLKDKKDKVQLASLILALSYGGIFVGPEYDTEDYRDETDSVLILDEGDFDILYLRIVRPIDCAIRQLTLIAKKVSDWQPYMRSFRDACHSASCCRDAPLRIEFIKSSKEQQQAVVPMVKILPATSGMVNQSVKQSKRRDLESQYCRAGWLCHRCLRLPWRGSLQGCDLFCNSCYTKVISDPPPIQKDVVFDVVKSATVTHIPRIIHQTWFEDVTTSTYPHLTRLQNSWKAMPGWEYRFYTDDTARKYIEAHYPKRFVEAYDALIPGAFKADLFRLLALLREGGVYADIDVQLDTDLNSFLEADISFFVPRDCPLDRWPNSNFCLWNGFMGSVPGHPILLQAVEDVMNHVLNRMDYYDIEGTLIQMDTGSEVWKLRSIPILLLTGPCALGMSVNKAAKIPNTLRGFPVGWLPEMKGVLMLHTDRYDLGELRFTDLDRNLLVGSSNAGALSRRAIRQDMESLSKKESVHYSKSESEIVGEHGVYRDDKTANEHIRLQYQLL